MPKIKYQDHRFGDETRAMIDRANEVIGQYQAQGFTLTLRQLYYQFVSRDLIPNTVRDYKRLGDVVNNARMAGLIDWDSIEDRTRNLRGLSHWDDPGEIIGDCVRSFRRDMWAGQKYRPEVWIEKDALAGVFEGVCQELDVPFFSCRGYTSQSEMWGAGQRMLAHHEDGKTPYILHFGDHDPSGIDMTRDIKERLQTFTGGRFKLVRMALNMNQVEQYDPPPNPAKTTDARFEGYMARFGSESWELDALEPTVMADLVRSRISGIIDRDAWEHDEQVEEEHRELLARLSRTWQDSRVQAAINRADRS